MSYTGLEMNVVRVAASVTVVNQTVPRRIHCKSGIRLGTSRIMGSRESLTNLEVEGNRSIVCVYKYIQTHIYLVYIST